MEKFYNDCFDCVSEYKIKMWLYKVIEGNCDLIEDGCDSYGDGSKIIIEVEEVRVVLLYV